MIYFRLAADDGRRMIDGMCGAIELAFASGAQRVATLHTDPLELLRADAGADVGDGADAVGSMYV